MAGINYCCGSNAKISHNSVVGKIEMFLYQELTKLLLTKSFKVAHRTWYRSQNSCCVVIVDLERFKPVESKNVDLVKNSVYKTRLLRAISVPTEWHMALIL